MRRTVFELSKEKLEIRIRNATDIWSKQGRGSGSKGRPCQSGRYAPRLQGCFLWFWVFLGFWVFWVALILGWVFGFFGSLKNRSFTQKQFKPEGLIGSALESRDSQLSNDTKIRSGGVDHLEIWVVFVETVLLGNRRFCDLETLFRWIRDISG